MFLCCWANLFLAPVPLAQHWFQILYIKNIGIQKVNQNT